MQALTIKHEELTKAHAALKSELRIRQQKQHADVENPTLGGVNKEYERLKAEYSALKDNSNKILELFQGQLRIARDNLAIYKVSDTGSITLSWFLLFGNNLK